MLTLIAFLVGLAVGIITSVLIYYNNSKKFIRELEDARAQRDAMKFQLESLIARLRGKER